MIVAILIISAILTIICARKIGNTTYISNGEVPYAIGVTLGILGLAGAVIAAFIVGSYVVKADTIDERMELYQTENARIEKDIATIIEQYKEYEGEMFRDISTEDSISTVVLYPELKTNTLVMSQIDIYVENNEKIKELKEEKIFGDVYRWWLYFGGK
jgi:hypothetical protein